MTDRAEAPAGVTGVSEDDPRGLGAPITPDERGTGPGATSVSGRRVVLPPVRVYGRRDLEERTPPRRADTIVVGAREYLAARYLAVRNWADDEVEPFRPGPPRFRDINNVTGLVLHETRGWAKEWSPQVRDNLEGREGGALAVHGYLGHDGTLIQHNDLLEFLHHSGRRSAETLGFEIINPMLERFFRRRKSSVRARYERLATVWDHAGSGHYLVPPIEQLEGVAMLVGCLSTPDASDENGPLPIPRRWPGIREEGGRRTMVVQPSRGHRARIEGIIAHGQLQRNKSDGIFPLLYAWLRLEAHLEPGDALKDAKELLGDRAIVLTGEVDLSAYALDESKPLFEIELFEP